MVGARLRSDVFLELEDRGGILSVLTAEVWRLCRLDLLELLFELDVCRSIPSKAGSRYADASRGFMLMTITQVFGER